LDGDLHKRAHPNSDPQTCRVRAAEILLMQCALP
jgi:hypothetical protein